MPPNPTLTDRPVALTGHDLYLFREGTHSRLYEKLGAHVTGDGTQFAVWAPNAAQVSVIRIDLNAGTCDALVDDAEIARRDRKSVV